MDVRDLRYFCAVAEHGSYSRAAERLGVSQPALSRAVQRLEGDLDVSLFDRHGHGVRLTDGGRALVDRAEAVLRQLDRLREEIQVGASEPTGVVDIAVPPGAATWLVPPLVETARQRHPRVSLRIRGGFSGELTDWVLRGQIDFACIHDPEPIRGARIVPLVSEEFFLVQRPEDAVPARRHVRIEELANIPLVMPSRVHGLRRIVDQLCSERGCEPDVRTEVDHQPILKLLVSRGNGATLLSQGAMVEELGRGELVATPLRPKLRYPLALVIRVGAPPSSARDALETVVRDVCASLTRSGEWPGRCLDRGWEITGPVPLV